MVVIVMMVFALLRDGDDYFQETVCDDDSGGVGEGGASNLERGLTDCTSYQIRPLDLH